MRVGCSDEPKDTESVELKAALMAVLMVALRVCLLAAKMDKRWELMLETWLGVQKEKAWVHFFHM